MKKGHFGLLLLILVIIIFVTACTTPEPQLTTTVEVIPITILTTTSSIITTTSVPTTSTTSISTTSTTTTIELVNETTTSSTTTILPSEDICTTKLINFGGGGDLVMFEDKVYYHVVSGNQDVISVLDLATRLESSVTTLSEDTSQKEFLSFDVHGDKVTYMVVDYPMDKEFIYVYDIISDTTTQIPRSLSMPDHLMIYGNFVVWEEEDETGTHIYKYDITSGSVNKVPFSEDVRPKDIFDKSILISERITNEIKTIDLLTGNHDMVVDINFMDEWDIDFPVIYGNNVAYTNLSNNAYSIYKVNRISKENKKIRYGAAPISDLSISNNWIVWDEGWPVPYIFAYNINSERFFYAVEKDHKEYSLFGDKIVWRQGSSDLFITDLPCRESSFP